MSQFFRLEVKGIAKDAHEKFPIKFDYGQSGGAYLVGCRLTANEDIGNGKTVEKRIDMRAFGEVAESLAHLQDGMEIHVKGSYGLQQSQKDQKWYPILTVDEVIEA